MIKNGNAVEVQKAPSSGFLRFQYECIITHVDVARTESFRVIESCLEARRVQGRSTSRRAYSGITTLEILWPIDSLQFPAMGRNVTPAIDIQEDNRQGGGRHWFQLAG
jgi:hypothetical protein